MTGNIFILHKPLDTVSKVYFIHVYFCEAMDSMQYRPPNTKQDVSNATRFGSISDNLGRLAALSGCMARDYKTMERGCDDRAIKLRTTKYHMHKQTARNISQPLTGS